MPTAEERARARRAERRAALRRAHPDLGGSPDALIRVLASGRTDPAATVTTGTGPGRLHTARRHLRSATTALRTRLPRGVPGALRRFTL